MKLGYLLSLCFLLSTCVLAGERHEVDVEIGVSVFDPYDHVGPQFRASFVPAFLSTNRFSFEAGAALHLSSPFNYGTTNPVSIANSQTSLDSFYFDRNYIEINNFDFFLEERFALLGSNRSKWKSYLTLTGGVIINSGIKTTYRTFYSALSAPPYTIEEIAEYSITYKTEYRTEGYISPGLLFGVGNFYFGYRHWFIVNPREIEKGDPARMVGTLRLGYRFKL